MPKFNTWAIGCVILLSLLVIFIVIAAVDISYYADKNNRISKAIENTNQCQTATTGICNLSINLDLAAPTPDAACSYSTEVALFQATLVACVEYPSDSNIIIPPASVTKVKEIFYNDSVIGMVCTSSDTIWVTFRGTSTHKEWEKDLMFQQVSYPHTTYESVATRYTTTIYSAGKPPATPVQVQSYLFHGMIHEGFLDVYNSIREQLKVAIDGLSGYLVVGGHSLGAALTTLLCADPFFKSRVNSAYVFGCPRVGNLAFVQEDCMGTCIFRVTNEADIVCQLPTSVSPNFTSGPPTDVFLYYHAGEVVRYEDNRGALLYNHAISNYITFLS